VEHRRLFDEAREAIEEARSQGESYTLEGVCEELDL
jgi:hypothetical protein